jgi:serine/threonine-protein kinase
MSAGTVLGRRYRIDARIAEGGMGIVYRGWHLVLEQQVAVKVMRPDYAHRPEAVHRLMNEARTMARLRGIHTTRVLDIGNIEGDSPYIVLEYLSGSDLRAVLDAEGPLPVGQAVDYLLQVCEGLAEAHALGIVHRDIKPGNVFLSRWPDGSEVIKLIDFGISKRADLTDPLHGHCLGSPQYMAPEQITCPDQVDARADIWSLGVLLYELLTGKVPFGKASASGTCCAVLCAEPTPLHEARGDLPPELEQVVLRCLRKRADERFPSVRELTEALAPFAPEPRVDSVSRVRRISGNLYGVQSESISLDVHRADDADGASPTSERPWAPDLNRTTQVSPGPPGWFFAAPSPAGRMARGANAAAQIAS